LLNGKDYSAISGLGDTPVSGDNKWYVEGDSIWTAWSGLWVDYTVNLTEGSWNIGLNVINRGDIGTGRYAAFQISNNLMQSKEFFKPS